MYIGASFYRFQLAVTAELLTRLGNTTENGLTH